MINRVGIVTYYSFYNYGSILQAFSTNETLKDMGYEPFLVDYADLSKPWNKQLYRRVIRDRMIALITHPNQLIEFIKSKRTGYYSINSRTDVAKDLFKSFIMNHFKLSDKDYRYDSSVAAYIAGSDQVWQLNIPGLHPTFFLRFCNKEKRIAYAASFGTTTVNEYNKKKLKKYLQEIPNISMREDVGVDIVRKILPERDNVTQTLDPVLLHDRNWWKKKIKTNYDKNSKDNMPARQYIVCYFLGDPSVYIQHIKSKAKEKSSGGKNIDCVWIATGYEKPDNKDAVLEPSPFMFVELISNADYIITDSLHGTEFSIVFHKQFTVCNRKYITQKEQSSRILSLLKMMNLNDRLIDNSSSNVDGFIDYSEVDKIIEQKRNESMRYLEKVLPTV